MCTLHGVEGRCPRGVVRHAVRLKVALVGPELAQLLLLLFDLALQLRHLLLQLLHLLALRDHASAGSCTSARRAAAPILLLGGAPAPTPVPTPAPTPTPLRGRQAALLARVGSLALLLWLNFRQRHVGSAQPVEPLGSAIGQVGVGAIGQLALLLRRRLDAHGVLRDDDGSVLERLPQSGPFLLDALVCAAIKISRARETNYVVVRVARIVVNQGLK